MNLSQDSNLTHHSIIQSANYLAPRIAERCADAERLRCLPSTTVDEIRIAGLHRILQPEAYGGAEAHFSGLVDVISKIAAACGSTGWVLAQDVIHNFMVAQFPAEAQREVWGETPDAFVCGVLIPSCGKATLTDKGWDLTGRWPFASGIKSAEWCILSALEDTDIPTARMFIVPTKNLEVHDTWYTLGLNGTGSNDVEVKGLNVPAHRSLAVEETKFGDSPGSKLHSNPLYKLSTFAMFSIVQSATSYGHARGTFNHFLNEIKDRTARLSGKGVASYGTTQIKIAEAAASLDAAKTLLYQCCDYGMEAVQDNRNISIKEKSQLRANATFAGNLAGQVVELLFSLAGGAGLYDKNRISRALRDMKCMQAHSTQNWDINGTNYGRVLLGLTSTDNTL